VPSQVLSREVPRDARDPDGDGGLRGCPAIDEATLISRPGDASKQAVKDRRVARRSYSKMQKQGGVVHKDVSDILRCQAQVFFQERISFFQGVIKRHST
jgi:hypothetical protein